MSLVALERISWRRSLEEAREAAEESHGLVFVELFSPTCLSCQNMEHRTFSDDRVIAYLGSHFEAVHFDVLHQPDYLTQFNAVWTPTLIFQSAYGGEFRRSVGFLNPDKFLAELALVRIQQAMSVEGYESAHVLAHEALKMAEGDEPRHAEALYWHAVTAYKASEDQNLLIAGWQDLRKRYPKSDWAARVDFVDEL
jgi:thioredoxin-related protein